MPNTAPTISQITVNGAPWPLANMASLHDLVTTLALDIRKVAIEHNGAIIPRSAYHSTVLAAGDRIEIVGFVGGG